MDPKYGVSEWDPAELDVRQTRHGTYESRPPPRNWHRVHLGPPYKARHAHKRLYTVLPKYSKIQVLPGITSCRLVKDNKQAIELNSLLLNNMPKDGYG